ncbi:hypothetical protein BO70DRAFT_384398 [Aspergillus heteromorphus CBS 117.55]|uniref:Uncharacterized protein n=1 Tax=Aspergillus heteromorphus CBS 117.55 TaxID=1448321 RepID=A0A317X2J9_9EURO|nr:uncharacterized protein BO70DRAFT_384398 [Aspergillus heteromorphus CBS 117.55]PWY90770.1 hypothetical protein BO70DRAFT_384398 [Aspergillus heteromorphus CBS 117.55]
MKAIEKSIFKLKSAQYVPQDLENIPIEILPLPLDSDGEPLFEPCFFDPYRVPFQDPDPEENYTSYGVVEGWELSPMDWARDVYSYLDRYIADVTFNDKDLSFGQHPPHDPLTHGTGQLWEHETSKGHHLDWRATAGCSIPDGPQYKCMMLDDVDTDDTRITRGELLCACRLMIKRLSLRVHANHMIAPVLLLSFLGPRHARLLLAHYDGNNLVIRKSELFDCREKNIPAFRVPLRWWCSSAVGDTITG